MMWERCRDLAASRGIETHIRSRVVRVHHDGARVSAVDVAGTGRRESPRGLRLRSSRPCPSAALVRAMDPAAPEEVQEAARNLRYRDFLIVGLIVEREHLFPDNWIYIHSPEVRVGRVQNFKNWSPDMVDDPKLSFVGLEYFANRGDDLWSMSDDELVALGASEAQTIGLFDPERGPGRHRGPHAQGLPGLRRRVRDPPARYCGTGSTASTTSSPSVATVSTATTTRTTRCSPASLPRGTLPVRGARPLVDQRGPELPRRGPPRGGERARRDATA